MNAPGTGDRFFRLCAQVAGTLLVIYAGIVVSFYLQPDYLSPPAVVLRILSGAFVFSGAYVLFAKQVRPLQLLQARPITPWRNSWQIVATFAVGCALCLFIIFSRSWLPDNFRLFHRALIAMKELTIPMGGIWMLHSFGEELFFRAFIYRELKAIFRPAWAILLASAFFAFAHLEVNGIPRNLIISVVMILCYELSGNFYTTVAAHAGLNTFAQYMMYFYKEGSSAPYGGVVLALASSLALPLLLQQLALRMAPAAPKESVIV